MEQLIPANILIGDRNYRLKVKPEDEEKLRKTVKIINEKIIEFKTNFAGKDMQDYIAMVLIWLATEQNEGEFKGYKNEELKDKVKSLQAIIEQALQ
ncbi:MAG TPA: cell division protein ZapA [Parafilimonas sp.]|jgi:cell division protein ZapA (FtsZ GTPase activity inhibitor)|nr:cell division protein ZapA [Parafilimonas sp.]